MRCSTPEAYKLLHDGTKAFARMEANGIRVDLDCVKRTKTKLQKRIASGEKFLREQELYQIWRRRFGTSANLWSDQQLGVILYQVMGFSVPEKTKSRNKRSPVDETALEQIDDPFVLAYAKIKKYRKLLGTYIAGIERWTMGEFCHPSFSLSTTRSLRSSSFDPNFQNMPLRNPESGKIIRSCFIARPGCRLVEIDYSSMEVRGGACVTKDPNLIRYIEDPTTDMHRDTAAELYLCQKGQVSKAMRHASKNQFVFPQFYGSYYAQCAPDLWESILRFNLELANGTPLMEHLESQGIEARGACSSDSKPVPGTFEHHCQKVERGFWQDRFRVYDQWKKDIWEQYNAEGGVMTATGFWLNGLLNRKQVTNYPIQGPSFHCLLWSMIRIQQILEREGWETKMVGQIHDSCLFDAPEHEVDELLCLVHRVMVEELSEAWDWIIVPLEIEAEVTPINGSWHQKKEVSLVA